MDVCSLPTEILIHVFDYLEPVFLLKTVTIVCKRFKNILDGDYYRLNYYKSLCRRSPHIEDVPMFRHMGKISRPEWKELGNELERVCERWADPKEALSIWPCRGFRMESVHVLKNTRICAVGTDDEIVLWDVRRSPRIVSTTASVHTGCVKDLDSYESETFFSGGTIVKQWKVREHSCEELWSSTCSVHVTSISCRPDIVAVATATRILALVDPRSAVITKRKIHQGYIENVKLNGNHVITVAEDRRLNVMDLRMLKTIRRFCVTSKAHRPTCLALKDNIVFVGDTDGYVHLLDKNQNFKEFQNIPVSGRGSRISSVCPERATFVCGDWDCTLRVVAPSKKHFIIKEIHFDHQITSMSSEDGILAIRKDYSFVDVYKPGRKGDDCELNPTLDAS